MVRVYADHASASPVRKEVIDAMIPYFGEYFGNPSNVYDMGSKINGLLPKSNFNYNPGSN